MDVGVESEVVHREHRTLPFARSGAFFLYAYYVIGFSFFSSRKWNRSLLFGSYTRRNIKDTKIPLITFSADKQCQ